MKKILYSGMALGLVLAVAPIALADTYSFSYVDSTDGITLSGYLTTDAVNNILSVTNATYSDTVTSVSGTAILDTNATDISNAQADNLFLPAGNPYLDNSGILLSISDGAYVNIYSDSSGTFYYNDEYATAADLAAGYSAGDYTETSGGIFTATDTPEPSSWLLLGSGLLGLMGIAYRRRLASTAVSNQ